MDEVGIALAKGGLSPASKRNDSNEVNVVQIHIAEGVETASNPIYLKLAGAIEEQIRSGNARIGERLPSERSLAGDLRLSRTTVVAAFQELEARGLVRRQVGRGTYVAASPGEANVAFAWGGKLSEASRRSVIAPKEEAAEELLSFGAGIPALQSFMGELRGAVGRVVASPNANSLFRFAGDGVPNLAGLIASRMGTERDRVFVSGGTQQALSLIAQSLIDPGDRVVVDSPGHIGAVDAFRAAGGVPVAWRAPNWSADRLEELLIRHRPKLIYTNPTFQNPTSATMPLPARLELLELAYRHRIPIVEDVAYEPLYIDEPPPPSLGALDTRGVVIQAHTLSTIFGPALRLGWVVAAPEVIAMLRAASRKSGTVPQTLVQHVAAEVLSGGVYDECLTKVRQAHFERRRRFATLLRRNEFLEAVLPQGGLYFWCRLRGGWDSVSAAAAAAGQRVSVGPGHLHYCEPEGISRRIRLCFTRLSEEQIDEGLGRIAQMLEATPLSVRRSLDKLQQSA